MACYHPLEAYQAGFTEAGKPRFVFKLSEAVRRPDGSPVKVIHIPCGQCIGCRLDRARDWAIRCVCEADMYPKNCFITLTYDDQNCDISLHKQHLQKFFRDLRYRVGPLRYFAAGEYGEQTARPHYHAIIFGHDFTDAGVLIRTATQVSHRLYESALLEDVWKRGFVSVGSVSFDSACYCARYCLKKVTGDSDYYAGREPEFCVMSRRPGIAHEWYELHGKECSELDLIAYGVGKTARPSRYFDKQFDVVDPDAFQRVKEGRIRKAADAAEREGLRFDELYLSDCTASRNFSKEEFKQNAIKALKQKDF